MSIKIKNAIMYVDFFIKINLFKSQKKKCPLDIIMLSVIWKI